MRNRSSTRRNYYCVWKSFNEFIIRLDRKPRTWENRLTLFVGYLVEQGRKSTTIKSYISAIKSVLAENNIKLDEEKSLLTSLTNACRVINDHVLTRLPIRIDLLHLLLIKINKYFENQPYLNKVYQAIFVSGYFGLLRIGELTQGPHVIRATDVKIGQNKDKILFVLHSSKTHDEANKPQFVKITGLKNKSTLKQHDKHDSCSTRIRRVCPFTTIRNFIELRPKVISPNEQFFVFSDNSPVKPRNVRATLRMGLQLTNIDDKLYSCHSWRIGRGTDLLSMGCSVETIKKLGRWRSNAVFRYLR